MKYIIKLLDNNENRISMQGEIFMEFTVIYKLLDPQLYWPLQVSALIILVLHITPTIIQQLSS